MFRPSQAQAKAKARLFNKLDSNSMLNPPDTMSKAELERHAGVRDISKWLEKDGFQEWFFNKDHNRELLESAVEIAIRECINILEAPSDGEKGSPKPGDKLNAMKTVLEYAGYTPVKKTEVEYKDQQVASMNEEELDKFIDKSLNNRDTIARELHEVGK